jgi:hypothetical protein
MKKALATNSKKWSSTVVSFATSNMKSVHQMARFKLMPVSDTGAGSKLMENAIIIVIKLMINDAV